MKIGIFGTGVVGRTLAARLVGLEHEVMIGTRDAAATLAKAESDMFGNPPFSTWSAQNPKVALGTFPEAAAFGEILWHATAGTAALEALRLAGAANLAGKTLVDITNPLDFSRGFPPSLFVCNTDSLGEQIQAAFREVKVVKSLNTMTAKVMVEPARLSQDHTVFVNGNDDGAKAQVSAILTGWFGWKSVIDLGDITASRGVEMVLPLWLRLMGPMKTPLFNFSIAK